MAEPQQMENCNGAIQAWNFRPNETVMTKNLLGVRGILEYVMSHMRPDGKSRIPLGHGDPSPYECFRTSAGAEQALIESIKSAKFNGYSPAAGLPATRRALADYLSQGFPYTLDANDVYLTVGCTQAIEIAITVLGREGANVLLPRPGFPYYEAVLAFKGIEVRYYDLVPERDWEIDLGQVEAIADSNTVAMVIINPSNPCGIVFSHDHLSKVAETARRLGLLIISDEAYAHIVFGEKPFVPMGCFASTVPVLTLGSISKRWMVPGWRVGWLAICDPHGILTKTQIVEGIKNLVNVTCDPSTIAQAAVPQILEKTTKDFYKKMLHMLSHVAQILYNRIQKLDLLYCPSKPQGSMFVMVKINSSGFEDINDDIEFCALLAKEESVIVLPGSSLGMKNWVRMTFAVDPSLLEEGLDRIESFCRRHTKNA
uniref:TSA: Wollemia nobilis Ref_Wollemi_Transcript_1586_1735 transcribed RNA sequence n=1 Tax=Wollemia nobilis TaxID=56998 RepID=A0A0C9RQN5_9CONI